MTTKMFALGLILTGLVMGVAQAAPEYVGPDGCSNCHKDEFNDWQISKHAKVFDLLEPGKMGGAKKKAGLDPDKDYTKDPKCLKCHTTGYKKPGGFESMDSTSKLAGVSCEMCHGPGSDYRQIHKTKRTAFTRAEVKAAGQTYGSVDPGVCKKCHGNPDSPFVASVDNKYADDVADLMKKNKRAFHDFYPLEGKH